MLSHALQMMGALYYLCSREWRGSVWPQSKCEIAQHVTTGLAEVQSNDPTLWSGEERGCGTGYCQSKTQMEIPAASKLLWIFL